MRESLEAQADKLVDKFLSIFPEEEKEEWGEKNQYAIYQDDPVAFGEKVLGEKYTDEVKAMMNSVRDYPITIAISATGTGKTFAASSVAIWWYKCFATPTINSQVWTAAAPPEDNLRKLLWGEIIRKTIRKPDLFTEDKLNDMDVWKPDIRDTTKKSGSHIAGVTIPQSGTKEQRVAKFSGKHAPHIMFIFDEGDAIPDEVFEGADGCMSGGHARFLIMFNPKRMSGAVYRMMQEGRANVVHLTAFNHPNVQTGRDMIPGAVTRERVVKRIHEDTISVHEREEIDSNCFEIPDFLIDVEVLDNLNRPYPPLKKGMRRVITPDFHYKVLGQYPPQGANQLISQDWIRTARERWDQYVALNGELPPVDKLTGEKMRPILGFDVADLGDDWNFICPRYGGFIARLIGWSGVDAAASADKAAEIAMELKAISVNVDSIGVGAAAAPLIRRKKIKAYRIMVSEKPTKEYIYEKDQKCVFGLLRDQLYWELREWLRLDPTAMIPPDRLLIEEMSVLTYEERLGKIKIMDKQTMREELGRSPDRLESLILTFAPREPRPKIRFV